MKYSPIDYAKVLVNMTNNKTRLDDNSWLKNFTAILEKNGDLSSVDEIIDFYKMLNLKKNNKTEIIIEYYDSLKNLENIKQSFKKNTEVIIQQNTTLKGGFRISINDLRIDNSIGRRLTNLKAIMV